MTDYIPDQPIQPLHTKDDDSYEDSPYQLLKRIKHLEEIFNELWRNMEQIKDSQKIQWNMLTEHHDRIETLEEHLGGGRVSSTENLKETLRIIDSSIEACDQVLNEIRHGEKK